MQDKQVFDEIAQISVIVDDVFTWVKRYNDEYGIGPWIILHFTPENTKNMTVHGKDESFEMYLALCDSLNVQLELIQPISDNSSYAEFLKSHGPGLHHMCMRSKEGHASILEKLKARGHEETLLSGLDSGGMEFCYFDLTEDLGFIVELCNPPEDFVPLPPDFTYPPAEK
jgi:hypothetical protein